MPIYFAFMQGTPQQEVAYVTTLLRDGAHGRWTAYLRRRCGIILSSCASFHLALLDRSGSKLWTKQTLENAMNLSQGFQISTGICGGT